MQYAADRFERTEPAELKRVPFSSGDDVDFHPGAIEAIGWAAMALMVGCLLVGFLGL